jgi:hypothetical protein
MTADADEDRASELVDRLVALGVGAGLTEGDVLGGAAREPLRACCAALVQTLWALGGARRPQLRAAAFAAAQDAAASERAAAGDALDASLRRLAGGVGVALADGAERVEVLEGLAAAAQAAAMLHAAGVVAPPEAEAAPAASAAAAALSPAIRELAAAAGVAAAPRATARELVHAARVSVADALARAPAGLFSAVLPPGALSEEQRRRLGEVDAMLRAEYSLRRRMVIERAQLTLGAFASSRCLRDDAGAQQRLREIAAEAGAAMAAEPTCCAADLATATLGELLAVTERVAGAEAAPAAVKSVVIGKVPDRGGRTEARSRAADMPAWTARKRAGEGEGGGGAAQKAKS